MNTWEQLALVEVDAAGIFAPEEALDIDEYHAALADQARVDAMPADERARFDATNEFEQAIYKASSEYADARTVAEHPVVTEGIYRLTLKQCRGELSPAMQRKLARVSRSLDRIRTAYRHQREAQLRTEAVTGKAA